MARDTEPVNDEEIEALREEIDSQRQEIREALADDLGGEPDDYSAKQYFAQMEGPAATDGGE